MVKSRKISSLKRYTKLVDLPVQAEDVHDVPVGPTGLAGALERGDAARVGWVRRGEVVPGSVLVDAWGLSRQALRRAVVRGELFTVKIGNRLFYPRDFLLLERDIVAEICKALGDLASSEKLIFWKRPHGVLAGKPVVDALRATVPKSRVVALARAWAAERRAGFLLPAKRITSMQAGPMQGRKPTVSANDHTVRHRGPKESTSKGEQRRGAGGARRRMHRAADQIRRRHVGRPESIPLIVLQGSGLGPVLSKEEAERRMAELIASHPPETQEEFMESLCSDASTADEVALRLSVTPQQLAELVATNKVIAICDTRGELQFPLRQFDENGPLEGLDALIAHFAAPRIAWDFLVSVCRMTDMKPPLDALRAGRVDFDYVLSVARAQERGDFF